MKESPENPQTPKTLLRDLLDMQSMQEQANQRLADISKERALTLEELRDKKETEAKAISKEISKWLQIASIAIPALMCAAKRGNVICCDALKKMEPLLDEKFHLKNLPDPSYEPDWAKTNATSPNNPEPKKV